MFEDEDSEATVVYELAKGLESNEIIVKEIRTFPTNRGAGKNSWTDYALKQMHSMSHSY